MHHSRFCAFIIDCNTYELDEAARFWSAALGRSIRPPKHGENPKYVPLRMRPDEPQCEIQMVGHRSRVHLDIETDDIEAEVRRLERLGARVVQRIKTWVVMKAPTGQRFCVVRPQRPDFPNGANRWE